MRDRDRGADELTSEHLSLTPAELEIVLNLLSLYVPDRPVWAFGSRASGRARRRSDLDLAIGGSSPLPAGLRYELVDAFDESDLPIEVDLIDLNEISAEFRERIEPEFIALTYAALSGPVIEAAQVSA